MKVYIILCCAFAIAGSAAAANTFWNLTDVDKLKAGLLEGYDPLTRPSDSKTQTKLSVGITIVNMELIESTGVLETHAWLKMNWTDSKLKWNPSEHDGIKNLRVTSDEIWQPDLSVYSSAEKMVSDNYAKTNKIVYNNGHVLWVPPAILQTYCDMDLRHWPFDEQTCKIKLGSWTFDGNQMKLSLEKDPIDLSYYQSSNWILKSSDAEHHRTIYQCCPEPYEDVTFSFTLARRSPMYKVLVVVPTVAIVFMVLVAFWLPPQAGEKLFLNGVASILVVIMLVNFSMRFPVSAVNLVFIVNFYNTTLYLIAVSFIISVITISMSRSTKAQLPGFLKKIFLDNFIEKIFACAKAKAEKAVEDGAAAVAEAESDLIRAAIVIDRIAFVVYAIFFICMVFCYYL